MNGWNTPQRKRSSRSPASRSAGVDWDAGLLNLVDGSLAALIFVAPLVMGGRHDLGRFVFAALASVAGVAWFARQTVLGRGTRLPLALVVLIAGAAATLALQLAPLPPSWLNALAPRAGALLPLWTGAAEPGTLGVWRTATLAPEATRLSLGMLAAYGLFAFTVHQRVQSVADATRLVKWVGLSAGAMAVIGLVQFAAPNGNFLWVYQHPSRDAGAQLSGAFANSNHFAHFVALGVPALAAWLALRLQGPSRDAGLNRQAMGEAAPAARNATIAITALLALAAVAVLLSCSRGGVLALGVAGGVAGWSLHRSGLLGGRALAVVAAAATAVFLAISMVGYDRVAERLHTLAAGSLDEVDEDAGRRKIWQANLAAIRAGGMLGAGAGSHADVYPVYLEDPPHKTYTHAESGYLQIVTENGAPGALVLAGALALAAWTCWRALKRVASPEAAACACACTAALAASAIHSAFDFVWYIPACLGATLVLGVCALRLATFDGERFAESASETPPPANVGGKARRGLPWAAGSVLAAGLAIALLWAPAAASLRWDAYQRLAAGYTALSQDKAGLTIDEALAARGESLPAEMAAVEAMIGELEAVVRLRPQFADAHRHLANRYVRLFNLRQEVADNPMPLTQVRDAAIQSQFPSAAALREWLGRAVGPNAELAYRAWLHARAAAEQAPLEGEPYVRLAELCFLQGQGFAETDAYLQQAVRLRPHDGELLVDVGDQWAARGAMQPALECWYLAFQSRGSHRRQVARRLAGQIPFAILSEDFAPQWDTLPEFWRIIRATAPADVPDVLAYAEQQAQRESAAATPQRAGDLWRALADMQREGGRNDAALASLARSCQAAPESYDSRRLLGLALYEAGRFAEGDEHLRWCLDRSPDDGVIKQALMGGNRQRYATQPETTR